MKIPAFIGLIGGIVVGILQFYSMMLSMSTGPSGIVEMFLYYSPQLAYFTCIYMSIKMVAEMQSANTSTFKRCLKAGGITAIIITIIWGIAFFIALTHINVAADLKHMMETGRGSEIQEFLASITKQNMADRARYWSNPNFLLGFAVTVLVTVIFRLKEKRLS